MIYKKRYHKKKKLTSFITYNVRQLRRMESQKVIACEKF